MAVFLAFSASCSIFYTPLPPHRSTTNHSFDVLGLLVSDLYVFPHILGPIISVQKIPTLPYPLVQGGILLIMGENEPHLIIWLIFGFFLVNLAFSVFFLGSADLFCHHFFRVLSF